MLNSILANPRTDLPSWAPDWALTSGIGQAIPLSHLVLTEQLQVSVTISQNILNIAGLIFDSVKCLATKS
jgi:hypothetical protein